MSALRTYIRVADNPQFKEKITRELTVIVRQLMQQFSDPMTARVLLQSQQNSDEAVSIKHDADPTFYFCGYLEALPDAERGKQWRLAAEVRRPRNEITNTDRRLPFFFYLTPPEVNCVLFTNPSLPISLINNKIFAQNTFENPIEEPRAEGF